MNLERAAMIALVAIALLLVVWIRMLPAALPVTDDWAQSNIRASVRSQFAEQIDQQFPALPQSNKDTLIDQRTDQFLSDNKAQLDASVAELSGQLKESLRYNGTDGKEHTYLGDLDSYFWLRYARNWLTKGTACDAVTPDGKCRDTFVLAPVGQPMDPDPSMHVFMIAYLYKFITLFDPQYPLPAASFLVPVLAGALGVIPAFFIGRRLAGNTGGFVAAVIISLHPLFLSRSMGSDNDVWNIVIPLFILWAAIEAFEAKRLRSKAILAAVAGLLCAVHATFWEGWWFIYLVVLLALAGFLVLRALQVAARERTYRIWQDGLVREGAAILAAFYVSALVFLLIFGERTVLGYLTQPLAALSSSAGLDSALSSNYWPNVLTTVAELNKASLADAVSQMGGKALFFAGLVGLLLLVLPRSLRSWRWEHYAMLFGGAAISLYIVEAQAMDRLMAVVLIGLPVGLILLFDLWRGERIDAGPALLVLIWMVASIYAAYSGVRFILLLITAFGIALAVLMGRVHEWASEYAQKEWSWHPAVVHVLVFLVLMVVLIAPVKAGVDTARTFVPTIDDGWWGALTKIHDQSQPDAIINSWWDFGHWFKYVAQRRVTADGTTQGTHVPYWLGKALVTSDENESVGILRMLDCGSDAYPSPEGAQGAYGLVLKKTGDPLDAERIVSDLVRLDKQGARAYLARSGFSAAEQDAVLNATHCDPPEDYFITSGDMVGKAGVWAHFGLWDFEKAYVAQTSRTLPQDQAVAAMSQRLNYTPAQAREKYFEAVGLPTEADVNAYVSPWPSYVLQDWRACSAPLNSSNSSPSSIACPIRLGISQQGTTITAIDSFTYNATSPKNSSLVFALYRDGQRIQETEARPVMLVIAGKDGITTMGFNDTQSANVAVVIDTVEGRVLLADPQLADSMFTRLFYLDGRYQRRFTLFDDRATLSSSRIITWKVDWDGKQGTAAQAK